MCRTGVTVVVVYVMPNGDCVTFYDNKITMFGYIAVFSFITAAFFKAMLPELQHKKGSCRCV